MREFPWEQELEKTPPAALASTDGISTHPVIQTSSSLAIYRKRRQEGWEGPLGTPCRGTAHPSCRNLLRCCEEGISPALRRKEARGDTLGREVPLWPWPPGVQGPPGRGWCEGLEHLCSLSRGPRSPIPRAQPRIPAWSMPSSHSPS